MSISLDLFPILSGELLDKVGFLAGDYTFTYLADGAEHILDAKSLDGQSRSEYIQITDERCEWTADSCNLSLRRSYIINNPFFLFGRNGIACNDAELGLALIWTSKSANQRGVKVIGGIKKSHLTGAVQFDFKANFAPGQLKGSVNLQTVIFLKQAGVCMEGERHLANSTGMLLGTLDESVLIIDGNGSVFPIVEVSEPSQPLWWVKCDWTDPQADKFEEENVRICLNRTHPSYQLLKLEEGLKGSPLLVDIIASAMQIIIQKVRESEYWDEIIQGQNCEQGSIAQAIHYFITTFDWNPHSPENLALTIRRDFDSRV